jgi:hypothetical protein
MLLYIKIPLFCYLYHKDGLFDSITLSLSNLIKAMLEGSCKLHLK